LNYILIKSILIFSLFLHPFSPFSFPPCLPHLFLVGVGFELRAYKSGIHKADTLLLEPHL
jgi:hypothetical protein